ncbi:MAG: Smr/MutS family protein [Desulfobacteraceae bacterium]|nr:Smr/MutS family protein [Desulfobacteraceae bacterium]
MDEFVEIPITGELDLHTFRPSEVGDLIDDYLEACLEKDITVVRIIHGKGTGKLRQRVHAALKRHRLVARFELAFPDSGGWGATRVWLKSPHAGEA